MQLTHRVASSFLVCVLVVGGIFAPLSHLVYMAATDMYMPLHGTTHADRYETCYKDVHDGHAACPYLTLFAVPLVGDLAQPITPPQYDPASEPLRILFSVQRPSTFLKFHLARGPPHHC